MEESYNSSLLEFLDVVGDIASLLKGSPEKAPPLSSPTNSAESSGCWSLCTSNSDISITEMELPINDGKPKESHHGRDILDLYGNLTSANWLFQPTVLPPKNPKMYLENRSVYHRQAGHMMELSGVVDCACCGFHVPVIL